MMRSRFRSVFSCLIFLWPLFVLLLLTGVLAHPASAATMPPGFNDRVVASGLEDPTAFAFASDGRIFIAEQGGAVRVIRNHNLLETPFATIPAAEDDDFGLLGIALHPDFPTIPYVYIHYAVAGEPLHSRIGRLTADADVAVAGSLVDLVDLDDLTGPSNHLGGALHFGPDGKLYVAVGENGYPASAQTLTNRLGKILRYDEDGGVPADNPFYDGDGPHQDAIWAFGLRNPYTFAFQPGTGRMFINDVGQADWEEIDDGVAGANYGWNTCEGFCNPPNANLTDPLYAYSHGQHNANGCAIVGGAFYNPVSSQFPADYIGDYFFADVCGGWIHRYDVDGNVATDFVTQVHAAIDLHVSEDGALYYLARDSGTVRRITYTAPPTQTPTVTFTQTASLTLTSTPSPSRTATWTPTLTRTQTLTPTASATRTSSRTLTPTATASPSPTRTVTVTLTLTQTPCVVSGPVLHKPTNGATVHTLNVRLDWADDPCAHSYRVQIQGVDGTDRQVVAVTLSKYRTHALEPGGNYQFRVIACDAVACERSKWSRFTVAPVVGP